MPVLGILRLGQPSVEVFMETKSTYRDAAAAVGIDASGTILINGATPASWDDEFEFDTTITVSANVKGAR